MNKSFVIALALILALIKLSNAATSKVINRLNEPSQRRKLIPISFNDKMCVDFGGWDWLTPFDGDYVYTQIINGKPSYQMQTCRNTATCDLYSTLNYNSGAWEFTGYPDTNIKSRCDDTIQPESPDQCQSWFGNISPNMNPCGHTQFPDNGISSGGSGGSSGGSSGSIGTTLTSADKQNIVDQHNSYRRKVALGHISGTDGSVYPKAAKMTAIEWDDALARTVQRWLDTCPDISVGTGHTADCDTKRFYCEESGGSNCDNLGCGPSNPFGGDIYANGQNGGASTGGDIDDAVNDSVKGWYEDRPNHFLQVIHEKSTKVGCGYKVCDNLEWSHLFYCNYYGPFITNDPTPLGYTYGETGSQCPNGHNNGLCN
mmetsp:Transcript_44271/g.39516  ORF Transcript_44271/g.39516 Transcript_44271/m.39516 type:complete len:371 (+) Transcript_44271:152-1264(+)